MKYNTVIFDFDGTIADNSFLFLNVLNTLSQEFGFKPISQEEIPALRHMSAKEILVHRLGIPSWNIFKMARLDRAQKRVWRDTAAHVDIHLFPGIPTLIKNIRDQNRTVGIVSSNLKEIIERTLRSEHVEVNFIAAGSRIFGKAKAIKETIHTYRIDPSRVVYVGDEIRDLEACRAVGIPMIGVGWGLNDPEALRARGADVAMTQEELMQKIFS